MCGLKSRSRAAFTLGLRALLMKDKSWDVLSPDLYKSLLAGITDAITVIDRDFRIVWANEQRAAVDYRLRMASGKAERKRVPQYTVKEMIGHHCFERFRRRHGPCPQCPSLTVFKTGKPCRVERRIDLPNGSKKWAETRAYPVYRRNGDVNYVIELSSEITEQKKNQEQEQRYVEAIEKALQEAAGHQPPAPMDSALLTSRENEVLRLLGRGFSNPEIARILQISPHTAKRHVANIFERIGVRDRAQAAFWAARQHLI
jgi:DNA-binding CsgD family transcriptional regulator